MLATVEANNSKQLINFRVPKSLKESFDTVCRFNASNRTQKLIELMKMYVDDEFPVMEFQHEQHRKLVNSFRR